MDLQEFETRKLDHLRLALSPANEAAGGSRLDAIQLLHRGLPELNLSEINIGEKFWNYSAASPFFISSMTAGNKEGDALNFILAKIAGEKKWPMGLGSQRRELVDDTACENSKKIRKAFPQTAFFSNLGLSQAITSNIDAIEKITDTLEASALILHCNPLQEALQKEGTPNFSGGIQAIEKICKKLTIPVIIKETGCGFSEPDIALLQETGIAALDISGYGGTHWGRIEGGRSPIGSALEGAAKTFAFWGIPTVDSLSIARKWQKEELEKNKSQFELWASGGIRSGLDAAKCIALGAEKIGFAKPALVAAQRGEEQLLTWMEQMELELKIALFCTGSKSAAVLRKENKWQKI